MTRDDLPFLRRRSRMTPPPSSANPPAAQSGPPASPPAARPGASANPLDLARPDEPRVAPLDLSRPGAARVDPLDLGSSTPAPTPAAPERTGSGLDLGSSALDLGSSTPAPASPQAPTSRHRALPDHDLQLRGIAEGQVLQFTPGNPVVQLTRTQSAAGELTFRAEISQPNDLILVAAFETTDGREGMVVPSLRPQGPDPSAPILRASSAITVNLRFITRLRRFFVLGVPRRSDLRLPGGTLVTSTYGGARLDLPLGTEVTLGAKALLTAYVVEGRIVLRAEHDPYSGTLQQVCDVYGYGGLSWRDPFTPL